MIAVSTAIAVASGLAGALQLTWGRFAAGGALMLVSVLALRRPRSNWDGARVPDLALRPRRVALLAVGAVAVFFRAYRFTPPGLWGDDAINALLAYDILDGAITSPFDLVSHAYSRFHALSNYPIAAAFWLFGAGPATLRLPGVIANLLAVPLLYGVAAPLFGARAALLAALFFASSPLQIAHAKGLIQVVLGEFFQLLGLCLLVRGVTGHRRRLVAAAGVPFALCLYTYHAAKLAPLVAIPYLVAAWHAAPRPRRGLLGAVVSAGVVMAVCALPGALSYAADPGALTGHVGATSVWPLVRAQGLAPLWDAVWRTLMIFHYEQGPEYHWFGLGFDPALNCIVAFLVVHGLVASLLGWREPRHVLLLSWVLVGLVPGFLSTGAPRVYRVLLATPPLYIWAALPAAQLWAQKETRRLSTSSALAALLVAAAPVVDFNYYFFRVYTHPTYRWFQAERMVEMAQTLRRYGPEWVGYLMSDNFDAGHETLRFLSRAWGLRIRDVASLAEVVPVSSDSGGALFMMTSGTIAAAAAIRAWYPDSTLDVRMEPELRNWWFDRRVPLGQHPRERVPSAAFLAIPPNAARAAHPPGLLAAYQFGDRSLERFEPYPFYAFFPPTFAEPFGVQWRGRLHVPPPGRQRLRVIANGGRGVWLDGQPIDEKARLSPGTHEFELQLSAVPRVARLQVWWEHPDGTRELVPPEAFSPPK